MGDRAYVHIMEEEGGNIFLYTHWSGTELDGILAEALVRGRSRWSDESYLTRIIFSEMIKDNIDGETGYGISTWEPEDERGRLTVNVKDQTVTAYGNTMSFEAFIAGKLKSNV